MKNVIITECVAALIVLSGCGKQDQASTGDARPLESISNTTTSRPVALAGTPAPAVVSTPVVQPILTSWQEGNRAEAINRFLAANWTAIPTFPAGMALGLTDSQFQGLPEADRQLRANEMLAQLELMKQLANAVAEAGQVAASSGDTARARKCFISLKQFGTALDRPAAQPLLRVVGQVSEHMADSGLTKLGS